MPGLVIRCVLAGIIAASCDSSGSGAVVAQADGGTGSREPHVVPAHADAGSSGAWVMGYYSSWNASSLPIDEIEWHALTHIATAFNVPDGEGGFDASSSFEPELAREIVSAAHAAGKLAIASIGGESSAPVFERSAASENLPTFVSNLKSLVTTLGYDGLDLDWEDDQETDYSLLLPVVRALREAMPSHVITVTALAQNQNIEADLSVYGDIAPFVDQINIMSYNTAGAYSGWKSWHSSALFGNGDSATPVAIDTSVADYLAARVPAAKLGVGTGFFGECYAAPVSGPLQPLAGSTVLADDGIMSYAHILDAYHTVSARRWDASAMVPYLSFPSSHGPEGCMYVTYEDAESIAAKADWVRANGLGGTIIWTLNEGYIATAPSGLRNPLLRAVEASFLH